MFALSVTRMQRQAILSTETGYTSRQFLEMVPTIKCGQMKKVGLADWRTSNGLPSASDPETEADRTLRESLLACMTANREPSNQSFEIDREATVCSASRRFLPFRRTPQKSVTQFLRCEKTLTAAGCQNPDPCSVCRPCRRECLLVRHAAGPTPRSRQRPSMLQIKRPQGWRLSGRTTILARRGF